MIFPEYEATVFLVDEGTDSWQGSFGIVTASNPGDLVPESDNRERNARLRRVLESDAGVGRFCPIDGCSPDLCHREASFAIWGLSRRQIVKLGQRWSQNAVFWIEAGQLTVVGCRSGRQIDLGRFRDRVRHAI